MSHPRFADFDRTRRLAGTLVALSLTASAWTQSTPPTAAQVSDLIERFDAAFNARDLPAIDRLCTGMYPSSRDSLRTRLEHAFRGAATLHRRTKLVDSTVRREYRIARVEASTRCDVQQQSATESLILLVAPATDRTPGSASALPRLVLAIAVDAAHLAGCDPATTTALPTSPSFAATCRACNYRLEADSDWLLVPEPAATAGSYEALTCWSLDRDVAMTLSLHLARRAEPAAAVLQGFLDSSRIDGTPLIEAWLPPSLRPTAPDLAAPAALDGARARMPLDELGRRAEIGFLSHGRVGYLFTTRGAESDVEALGPSIDRLFAGFRLLDATRDPESIATAIESQHFTARVEGGNFHDVPSGVRFEAPAGFLARLAGGFARFDAAWCCPLENPTFRLRGLGPPAGMSTWSRAAADRLLQSSFGRSGLRAETTLPWTGPRDGFEQVAQLRLTDAAGKVVRLVRVALWTDLCVVLEADTTLAIGERAASMALSTLRRER
ncbi:MAG: hypothetical protein AB7I19_14380 [Planctomycetota bacterium]